MSYITPNTDLYILNNVPLDVKNNYSIAFQLQTQQELYFFSKIKYRFTNLTYQRENKGWVRVERNAEDLYDCNYMMFRNTAFGTKWFYAFIIGVEYVSNSVSRVEYVIDYLQTWLYDYQYMPCYTKRIHTETDNFGDSLTAEPFNIDDYVYNYYDNIDAETENLVVIIGVSDTGSAQVDGHVYQGIYGGAELYAFLQTDVQGINSFLAGYKQHPDEVVFMYLVPKILTDAVPNIVYGQRIPESFNAFNKVVSIRPLNTNAQLDGYLPKNKKLYTYPYNFLQIDNGTQETLTLRYELFDTPETLIQATIDGTFASPPEVIFTPTNYKNNWVLSNSTDVLTMGNYPMLSWNNNAYKSWMSVNWFSVGREVIGTGLDLARGSIRLTSEKIFDLAKFVNNGSLTQLVNSIHGFQLGTLSFASQLVDSLDVVDKVYKQSKEADQLRGNISSGNSLIAVKRKQYHQANLCIRHEQAEIIDNFFSMYGYAMDRIITPSRRNRPHWTYIQTANCMITGDIPADAKFYIESVHDRGITWWANASEIGDYTLDNSPASNQAITVEASETREPITE